jgi:hypothetical protein
LRTQQQAAQPERHQGVAELIAAAHYLQCQQQASSGKQQQQQQQATTASNSAGVCLFILLFISRAQL